MAMTVVLDWNEVGVVARHESNGARGVGAEKLGETPLKGSDRKRDKNDGTQ